MGNIGYILGTIVDGCVDIFTLIEVQTKQNRIQGRLIDGSSPGAMGVISLLKRLRDVRPTDDWCVVPPVSLNQAIEKKGEGIAVFFRNNKVDFTGPLYYKGEDREPDNQPTGAVAYPETWNSALPPNNFRAPEVIPLTPLNESLQNEVSRGVQLTSFSLKDSGQDRTLLLFSVHLKPEEGPAQKELSIILEHPQFKTLKQTEVAVITGDTNYDFVNNKIDIRQSLNGCFFKGFRKGMEGEYGKSHPTMIEDVSAATLETNHGTAGGTSGLRRYQIRKGKPRYLDNAYVRYGKNPLGQVVNARVVDRVQGTPQEWSSHMTQTVEDLEMEYPSETHQMEQNDEFRLPWNYGHMGPGEKGVSDHLPIVIDIP